MKLLACSDFQLGAGSDYGAEPGSRLRDQEDALSALLDAGAEAGCEAVLFCGDAFQHRRPSAAELMVFRRFLDEAARAGLEVLGCAGNHDHTGPGQPSSLELFNAGVRARPRMVSAAPALELLHDAAADEERPYAAVGLLPWVHPGHLRAASEGAASPLDAAEKLVEVAGALKRGAPEGLPSILCLHWALSGCSLPQGLPTSALREPVLDLEDLRAQGWDWIIAGHIHMAQQPAPNVIVCGSPAVCDFGEAELEHGGWIIDLEAGEAERVVIPGRPFLTLEMLASDTAGDHFAQTEEGWLEGAVVKVRVRGLQSDLDMTDFAALREAVYEAGAHKLFALEVLPERAARARAESASPDLAVAEALELWLAAVPHDPALAEPAREQARQYVEEAR